MTRAHTHMKLSEIGVRGVRGVRVSGANKLQAVSLIGTDS